MGGTVEVGGTSYNALENNIILSAQFTMPETSKAYKMGINIYSYVSGAKIVLGIYADNGNTPVGGAKLAQTNEITINSTGWNEANLQSSVQLTGGTKYWMAIMTNDINKNLFYNSGNSPFNYYKSISYSSIMPNPYPSGCSTTSAYFNERMTYGGESYTVTISEILGLIDGIQSKKLLKKTINEVLGLYDSVNRSKISKVSVLDILGLKENIERYRKTKFKDLPDHTITGGASA